MKNTQDSFDSYKIIFSQHNQLTVLPTAIVTSDFSDIVKTSVIIFNWYKRNTKIYILIYIPIDVKLQNHLRCQFVRRNSIQGGHNTPSCLPIQE